MTKKIQPYLIAGLLTATLLIAACSPSKPATPTVDTNVLITQAAQTVAVQLTQNAVLTPSPAATNTLAPTALPLPTEAAPQAGQPTAPPANTNTPQPATQPTKAGDAGSFVADVTVPDGTGAVPGSSFDKTWRIKNTGVTTWTTSYSLAWVDGDKMGAPDSVPMPKEVRPGEEVEISVHLTAPAKAGLYQTYFRLRNAGGQFFRLDGTGDLWLKINVGGSSPTPNLTQTAGYTPVATGTPTLTVTPTP